MENSASEKNLQNPIQEKVLFSWKAHIRHFEKKSKEFYTNALAVLSVIALIIFVAEGWVPVVLLISLGFLYFVMHSVEPEIVDYQITNFGIRIKDKLINWDKTTNFWITEDKNTTKLNLGITTIPGKMELIINPEDKDKIKNTLREYLPEIEIPPSTFDKITNWFLSKIEK